MSTSSAFLSAEKFPPPPLHNLQSRVVRDVHRRPSVIVVDDEHLIADTVTHILRISGFDAVAAYSGESALKQASKHCPDILITDVVMPNLNGIEIAKRLLGYCRSTKVLLLSGQAATTEMMTQARSEGFTFELLAKPVHPDDLLAMLGRLGF